MGCTGKNGLQAAQRGRERLQFTHAVRVVFLLDDDPLGAANRAAGLGEAGVPLPMTDSVHP